MAKPNYQFEKRQRDLAKKRKQEEKQEEKRRQKLADKAGTEGSGDDAATPPDAGTMAVTLPNDEAISKA